ncbi:MAG: VCBS repeat-containing protein [Saprospiraceae bacterium]|nr:VCBS repeat-containing protein [Saprospiraceae bacterium]
MKKLILLCIIFCISNFSFAQGGWIFDTNPLNDVVNYTTIYPYVGCSFVEINGDNFVDLIASPKTVFLNNGDGTFSQTTSLPFTIQNGTAGSSSADLDNDGDNDIIVACVPTKVFFNNGNGTFSDSTSQIPSFGLYGSWAVAIGDYNENRELDFIFAHAAGYHAPAPTTPCKFYRQQSTIFDPLSVSLPPITDSLNSYTNPYWSDYDLDGDMDLFMASGPVMGTSDFDFFYKNLKIETGIDSLVPMTTELFATQTQDGQCYNFIDYDNDGDFDLCLTNYFSAPTRMYKNTGGIYTSIATAFTTTTTNIANCWGDYDNDGDQDVIITNDNQITKYYRNNNGASFTYLAGGFSTPTATNGITNADYDNDGDLDVFTNGIGNNGNTSSVGLFINDTVAGNRNFVNIKLVGVPSNRSAIGTIIKLHAIINGNSVWQMREVNAQNSFQGQNDLRVHFGLGDATVIDSIIIIWSSGATEYHLNYAVNSFYQITEGNGVIILSSVHENNNLQNSVRIFPNPTNSFFNVQLSQINNEPTVYCITNMLGAEILIGKVTHSNFSVDLEHLPSDIYNFTIQSSKGIIYKRIMKL